MKIQELQSVMPSTWVYHYTDYRSYLKAQVADKKRRNQQWSLSLFAKNLDLSSRSSVSMILNGSRQPAKKTVDKICRYFSLDEKESAYFSDLVRLQKVKDDTRLSVLLMEKIQETHPNKKFQLIDEKSFSFLSNWYSFAIREMSKLPGAKNDPDWFVKKLHFKVNPSQIKKAIDDMISLGLLRLGPNGELLSDNGQFSSSDDIESEALKQFHEAHLALAKEAIRKFKVEDRFFSGVTLNLNEKKLPRFKEMIKEFEDLFIKTGESEPGTNTFQLNIQLYPLTKGKTKNEA